MQRKASNRVLAFIMALMMVLPFFTPVAHATGDDQASSSPVEESLLTPSEDQAESLLEEVTEESNPERVTEEAPLDELTEQVSEDVDESAKPEEETAPSQDQAPEITDEVNAVETEAVETDGVETDAVEVVIDPKTLSGAPNKVIKEVNVHFGPVASSTRNISWVTVENTEALLQVLDANGNLVYSGKVSGESNGKVYTYTIELGALIPASAYSYRISNEANLVEGTFKTGPSKGS